MSHPLSLLLLLWSLCSPAYAVDTFEWLQPPPEEQLAADDTIIPVGKGAVFVPSLTSPSAEPPVILVNKDDVVDIPTGKRVILDPGIYTIVVSPGSPGQGVGHTVRVREGETSLVPVTWGALRIHITDDRRIPFRGQYDLIRADTRETIGTGFGVDSFQGEQLMTWLLPPGVYRIVKPGANYRQLRNYATVYVPEGGLVRYRLVIDTQTGDFLGSGTLVPGEFGSQVTPDKPWYQMFVVGVDGSLVQTQNVVGQNNQMVISGNLFIDHQIGYQKNNHHFKSFIQVELGATAIRPQSGAPLPIVKTRDRIQGDLLYTWFGSKYIGPYARVGAQTQAFPSAILATEDTDYSITNVDGSVETKQVLANNTLRISNAWQPSVFRQGTGLNLRALNNKWITFNLRAGLGFRENLIEGTLILIDDPDTPEVEYAARSSFNQQGLEGTAVLTARLPGWVVYSSNLEVFAGFSTFDKPSLEWRNTVSLRLTKFLSLNYFANVDYLPQVVDTVQLEHSVVLRAAWTIL